MSYRTSLGKYIDSTALKMDKSFVFPRQYRSCLSPKINAQRSSARKLTNQNRHWHGDTQFSWPEDNDLRQHYRYCLFLSCSYRDNPVFFTQCNI